MNNIKTIKCSAFSSYKAPDHRVCDFAYITAVIESDLSDYAKYVFCKYFSNSGFRHGWLLTFRRAIISNEEYRSLNELATEKFIELRDEGEFISIVRPYWPEVN